MRLGSNNESQGKKIVHYVVNGYHLVIIKDIEMWSTDAYTECYGQHLYGILDLSTPKFWKIT